VLSQNRGGLAVVLGRVRRIGGVSRVGVGVGGQQMALQWRAVGCQLHLTDAGEAKGQWFWQKANCGRRGEGERWERAHAR
jgi:hypothetical protein